MGRYKAGVHKDIKDEGKINRERQIDYIHSHYNKEREARKMRHNETEEANSTQDTHL